MAEIVLRSISHSYQARRGTRGTRGTGGDVGAGAHAPVYALRDIELRWRDGGAYALLGPSGCGKSTLLGIISGLIRPTRGQVLYGGKDVTNLPSRERNIAQVFQFPVVYDTMTVHQNLAFPLRNRGLAQAEIDRRVEHIAEVLELTPTLPKRATGLTADQKQILALGRGLVREDVAAILFDEPLTVIDPHRKWMLRRMLKEIHQQFHHTLIYVTHDQTEALTFADEVVVMSTGEVLQRGTPEDLFLRPAHTYVGYFIGSPGMNIVPCELVSRAAGLHARVAHHELALSPALGAAVARVGADGAGRLELGIRPEHLTVLGEADAAGGVPVVVEAVEDHGRFRILTGRLGEHALKIRVVDAPGSGASTIAVAPGQEVRVRVPPEHLCLYRDSRIIAAVDPVAAAAAVDASAGAAAAASAAAGPVAPAEGETP